MTFTSVTTGTDLEILELLDFDTDVECCFPDCNTDSTWMILCPRCGKGETACNPHHQAFKLNPNRAIAFDACGHTIPVKNCRYIPFNS